MRQDDMVSKAVISEIHSIRVNSRIDTGWKWDPCHCSERLISLLSLFRSIVNFTELVEILHISEFMITI